MKLFKIVSTVTATLAMTALMSLTAMAATNLKLGECSAAEWDSEDLYKVPVTIESTDYDSFSGLTLEVAYDTSKYTLYDVTFFQTNSKGKVKETSTEYYSVKDGYVVMSPFSAYDTPITAGTETPIVNLYFEGEVPASDISIQKLSSITTTVDGSVYSANDATEFATYVEYRVPKKVGSDWSYGFVTHIQALIYEAGTETVLGSAELKNYIVDGDDYVFIVKLVPGSSSKTVDVKAVLSGYKDEDLTVANEDQIVTVAENVFVGKFN